MTVSLFHGDIECINKNQFYYDPLHKTTKYDIHRNLAQIGLSVLMTQNILAADALPLLLRKLKQK